MRKDSHDLGRYISLIQSLINREVDAQTFERMYLDLFKNDTTDWSKAEYEVLNDLFGDVDAFCSDPQLCGPDDLNENQLRQESEFALERLVALTQAFRS
jgi:hypothetical protein